MGRISALTELTSLASDDYLVVLDSSANIAKKITVANAFGITDLGWVASGESWTYASWDSSTRIGTITVPTDATTKYTRGMRVKITQSTGGTKYGIIHDVAATLLTVHFPSGITFNNEAITSPQYSLAKAPLGFPTKKTDWQLSFTSSSTTVQTSPSGSTWYNTGSPLLALGKGQWNIRGRAAFQLTGSAPDIISALSTSSSSASHSTAVTRDYGTSRAVPMLNVHNHELDLDFTSAGTIYIIFKSPNGATYDNRGDTGIPHVTSIIAVTNYL